MSWISLFIRAYKYVESRHLNYRSAIFIIFLFQCLPRIKASWGSGIWKHINAYHYLRNFKMAYLRALIPSLSVSFRELLLTKLFFTENLKKKEVFAGDSFRKQNLSIKLHAKSFMLLLCCILYIGTPGISSPSVSTQALVSRSLTLDNVEDLHIVCSVAELCTWNNYQSFPCW